MKKEYIKAIKVLNHYFDSYDDFIFITMKFIKMKKPECKNSGFLLCFM